MWVSEMGSDHGNCSDSSTLLSRGQTQPRVATEPFGFVSYKWSYIVTAKYTLDVERVAKKKSSKYIVNNVVSIPC